MTPLEEPQSDATTIETLEDFRRQRDALDTAVQDLRTRMEAEFHFHVGRALFLATAFKEEFGEAPAFSDTEVKKKFFALLPGSTGKRKKDGRQIGGLKRSLAVAREKGDSARVAELEGKIAARSQS